MDIKLPIYKASVSSEDSAMFAISLVDFPATESDFLFFDEDKKLIKFSVENEEKRIVRGLVMGCNQPIYRRYGDYEYYIVFDKETIRQMSEKYFKFGFQNNVDTNHDENYVDGVNLVQMFIKDSEDCISPKGFEDYEDGSLFAEFHIENDEIWTEIKNGTYKGFSLAGVFDLIPEEFKKEKTQDETDYEECLKLVEKINKKLKRK